jgi:hypothetical protein
VVRCTMVGACVLCFGEPEGRTRVKKKAGGRLYDKAEKIRLMRIDYKAKDSRG